MVTQYDAIVIGTGQAGPPLAARLGAEGMRTAVIERKLFGGTCVNTGCIPTKTLVASARAAYVARRAAEFGVVVPGPVDVDMKRVKARKDSIVRGSSEGVATWMRSAGNVTVYEGHGRFEGPHEVRVNGEMLRAERVFIDVGARATVPPLKGLDRVSYLTNSSMMEVDFLPEHLVVIGGSYIGLEFAQMYRRFGSRVTVIEMQKRPIAREDEDVSAAVQEILQAEGVEFRLGAECLAVERRGSGVSVTLDCAEGDRRVAGSDLLLAVGRTPNTGDLGLDKAGVEMDERGYIAVDDELRTSVPHIWALGECNGHGAFTHTAYNDYEIVAANLLDGGSRRVSDRIQTYALFIDPPLGRAGMSEGEARKAGRRALVARLDMKRVGRARERGETQGFLKLVVDAETQKILGAAMLGIEADELVQSILNIMYADAPYTLIERAMYIHPTVSEFLPTLVGELEPVA